MTNIFVITFSIYIAITLSIPRLTYASCKKHVQFDITAQTTTNGLLQTMNKWEKDLSTECYYYIGKQYFDLFGINFDMDLLSESIKFLEFVLNNLKPWEHIYKESQKVYSQAKLLQSNQKNINHLKRYAADPISQEYPEHFFQLIKQKGIHLENAAKIENIHKTVSAFQTKLSAFAFNQSVEYVKELIDKIEEIEKKGINANTSSVGAVKKLYLYYETVNNIDDQASLLEKCYQYEKAFQLYRKAKNDLSFLVDSMHTECKKNISCLSLDIQKEMISLMPEKKNIKSYKSKLDRCEYYQKECQSLTNQCDTIQVTGDQRHAINDLIHFYKAYHYLQNPPKQVNPTSKLYAFMNTITHKQDTYANQLFNLAGYYNATFFYQQSERLLYKGPDEEPIQTLEHIRIFNEHYRLYKKFLSSTPLDIEKEYRLLSDFFYHYTNNPARIRSILNQLNPELKTIWKLQSLIN